MMTKFFMIGICVLGGIAGFFLGGIFFNVFLVEWAGNAFALWGTTIGFAMIGVCLAYYFE